MGLFDVPPTTTQYTFKVSDVPSLGAFAIQSALNDFTMSGTVYPVLTEDGYYGQGTANAVKLYQQNVGITADGVCGPSTQARIATSCRRHADPDGVLPAGLIDSVIAGESGGYIAAVNTSVAGGTDCSFTQRRVYTPYDPDAVKRAFQPLYQVKLLVSTFKDNFAKFSQYAYVQSRPDTVEYAWRCASLNHNYPYGAEQKALGKTMSSVKASWVPAGAVFEDGAPVFSYEDWVRAYAIGSHQHQHRGYVVKQAFGVPFDG